jgi:hypothetical protein
MDFDTADKPHTQVVKHVAPVASDGASCTTQQDVLKAGSLQQSSDRSLCTAIWQAKIARQS